MITDKIFAGLLDAAQETAKASFQKYPNQEHPPLLIFMDGNDDIQTAVIQSLEDKDIACAAMRELLRQKKAYAYFFVSEAWVSCPRLPPEDWKNALAPSKDPERQECVLIYGWFPSGRRVLSMGMIEDGKVDGMKIMADSAAGTWLKDEDRFGSLL